MLPVIETIQRGEVPKLRMLSVEFNAIQMSQARIMGVSEEWIRRVAEDNSADLHVNSKGDGPGMDVQDMLDVTVELQTVMKARHATSGIAGTFILHPTGAAIVKKVTEMLAGALGGYYSLARAAYAQRDRRQVEPGYPAAIVPESGCVRMKRPLCKAMETVAGRAFLAEGDNRQRRCDRIPVNEPLVHSRLRQASDHCGQHDVPPCLLGSRHWMHVEVERAGKTVSD